MMKRVNEYLEPMEVYLSDILFKDYGIVISPKDVKRILSKRLRFLLKECLKGKRFRAGHLAIGIHKKSAEKIPSNEKKFWVFSNFNLSTMFTFKLTFKEEFKGYYKFRPNNGVLNTIRNYISQDPEFEFSMYIKPEEL